MFRPMKPKTAARFKKNLEDQQAKSSSTLILRLQALAERDGPDSIWAEMLAETKSRIAQSNVDGENFPPI